RIYYFENALQPQIFVGSADWMPRNFFGRIEVVFPVEDGNLRERVISELLACPLADNTKARVLQPDSTYQQLSPKRSHPRRSQVEFLAKALDETGAPRLGRKIKPYPEMKLVPRPKVGGNRRD